MSGTDPYVPHRGDARYRVRRYDLDLDYRPATNALVARARLDVEAVESTGLLELDLVGLDVRKVSVDGRAVTYRHRRGRLAVHLPAVLGPGDRARVDVRYAGRPAPVDGPWGDVGWEELTDGALVAGQPDGAPTWFPCNDLPSDKAVYGITVRTDSAYTVVANGVLVDRRASGSRTTWTFAQAEPMATYLATVQIGRYERRELARTPVPQSLLSPVRLRHRARWDTARQAEMMDVFVRLFGPYPFASYTVVVTDDDLEIPLEAQGMSVFGANHVDGERGAERLVAHELAHQWFGNSLTAASWRHVWLHEGFACYAEWLWSEASGGPSADVLARHAHGLLAALPQDLRLCDPGPELMFDDRVYKRGALCLHALRTTAGDDGFSSLLRSWAPRHRHGSVTTQQFVDHAAQHAGEGVRELLRTWLEEPALPALPQPAAPSRR